MRKPLHRYAGLLIGLVVVIVGAAGLRPADAVRAQERRVDPDVQRINDAIEVFSNIVSLKDKTIPRAVLEKAEGMVVFPQLPRIPSRRGQGPNTRRIERMRQVSGRGIVSARQESGTWSPPGFITLTGGSIPYDADLVLVIMNRRGLDNVMRHEFAIGADAAVVPGPVGTEGSAWTEEQQRADIFSYSQYRGAVAGIPLVGTTVEQDMIANQRFYGKKLTTARAIAQTEGPEPVAAWRKVLQQHASR
jgi:lipid-binding SYLF domain-containing protein